MATSIDDLPTELIAQIFDEAVMPEQWDSKYTLRDLSIVCRRWRDVAYDTPGLWRYISINLDFIVDAASEARCRAYLDTFILRANERVSLDVFTSVECNTYRASIWLELRRLVGSVCWSFRLEAQEDAPQITACLDQLQVAPQLEVLCLDYRVESPAEFAQWTLPRAPKLRELVWRTCYTMFRWPSTIETFPLLRNICVCAQMCDWLDDEVQVAEIFSRCPHLVTLDLNLDGDVDFRSASPIRLEVGSLRTLSLSGGESVSLMSTIRLPNLENAAISSIAPSDLPTLFGGPLAMVTNLVVRLCYPALDGALARSLVYCLRLQHLRVDPSIKEKFAEFLEVMSKPLSGTDAWICPGLISLTIYNFVLEKEDPLLQDIVTFARARTNPSHDDPRLVQRLERLVIIPPKYWLKYVRPSYFFGDQEYRWLNSTLEGLGLSTAPT